MILLESCELLKLILILTIIELASSATLFPEAFDGLNSEFRADHPITQSETLSEKAKDLAKIHPREWNENGPMILCHHISMDENTEPEKVVTGVFEYLAKFIGVKPMFATNSLTNTLKITTTTDGKEIEKVYKTGKMILEGNQGQVLLGKEERKSNLVVIKKPQGAQHIEAHRTEAEALRYIGSHSGIVKMLDAGTQDGSDYFVILEPMLADMCQMMDIRGKCLDLKTSIIITKRLLEAVSHIHARDYVHRDIKVDNIMYLLENGKVIVKLIDFGLAKRYRSDGVRYPEAYGGLKGTFETMSIFTHQGFGPSPRDDIWGVFITFIQLHTGTLPWGDLCTQFREFDKQFGDKLTKEDSECIWKNHREIAQIKLDFAFEFVEKFPELWGFVDHIWNLKFEDDVDFDLLQNCLDALMRTNHFDNDGRFDWDDGIQMLFRNPNTMKAGVGLHYSNGWRVVILVEKFYATIQTELSENDCRLQVLEELNTAVMGYNNTGNRTIIGTIFQANLQANEIENLQLSHFDKHKMLMDLLQHKRIYAGFGYSIDCNSNLSIYMVLEPLVIDIRIKSVVHLTEQKWMILKANTGLYLKAKNLDYTTVHIKHGFICHTEVLEVLGERSLTEYDMLHQTVIKMSEGDIKLINSSNGCGYGFAWKELTATGSSSVRLVETYVMFTQKYNSLKTLQQRYFSGNSTLVWCSDESAYEIKPENNDISTSSDGPSSIGNLVNTGIPTEISTTETNCEAAVAWASNHAIENKMLAKNLLNVRVKWNLDAGTGHYKIKFIQDSFYGIAFKTFAANKFPEGFEPYQFNWIISEAGPELCQSANSAALDVYLEDNQISKFETRPSLICIGAETKAAEAESLEQQILINVKLLHDIKLNDRLLEFNPHDIATVAYGYHVTAQGSVKGFSIYETYCHEALTLINIKRKLHELQPLELKNTNFTYAENLRNAHRGSTSSLTFDDTMAAFTKFSSANATTKEVLSLYVKKFLEEEQGTEYDKVMKPDAGLIGMAIFQAMEGGEWLINIEVDGKFDI